jgi:hypothetical protein
LACDRKRALLTVLVKALGLRMGPGLVETAADRQLSKTTQAVMPVGSTSWTQQRKRTKM